MLTSPLARFLRYIIFNFVLYGAALWICHRALEQPALIDLVTACKIVSLVFLVIVSEGIARDINPKEDGDIQSCSRLLSILALALIVFLTLDLLHVRYNDSRLRQGLLDFVEKTTSLISYLSIIPIFGYSILNFWAGFLRKRQTNLHHYAKCYFIFADCTCIVPIMFSFFIMAFPGKSNTSDSHVFFSGSLAVILFVSNTISKALDEFLEEPIAEKISERIYFFERSSSSSLKK